MGFFQDNGACITICRDPATPSLVVSKEDFEILEPGYALPACYQSRIYTQGYKHTLTSRSTSKTTVVGGENPWAEGDAYISKIESYQKRLIEIEAANKTRKAKVESLKASSAPTSPLPDTSTILNTIIEHIAATSKSEPFVSWARNLKVPQEITSAAPVKKPRKKKSVDPTPD